MKIRNQSYSQWAGRQELFERERDEQPNFQHWAECALACESVQLEYSSEFIGETFLQTDAYRKLSCSLAYDDTA
jgi:hypothetical protein